MHLLLQVHGQVTTQSSNLNIRKSSGTDQPIIGKAAHNEVVSVISKANDQWSLIRTAKGEEGMYIHNMYTGLNNRFLAGIEQQP